jgi:peptidoglycan hydrolase CwlO-like protein
MQPLLLDTITINAAVAATIIGATMTSFTTVGVILIRSSDMDKKRTADSIIKKLDEITCNQTDLEKEIRPLTTTLAEHSVELKNLKENLAETNKWVVMHDQQIQSIHRELKRA